MTCDVNARGFTVNGETRLIGTDCGLFQREVKDNDIGNGYADPEGAEV